MTCFVVLHYMVKEETMTCVNNLQMLTGEKRIVIIDNASPNGTGEELYELYKNTGNIDVLLNADNVGFAGGNNVGYVYARIKYDPDFIIVINNDIQIKQKDFIAMVETIYNREQFAVLGPDVYAPTLKIHQNPKRLRSYSYSEVQKLVSLYDKKCRRKIITRCKCCLKKVKILKSLVYNKRIEANSVDYKTVYYGVPLHGSCFIFSRLYISRREKSFFEGTFMYYESEILDYECHRDGLKSMYSPEVQVIHNHNVSTNVTFKSEMKKTDFMNKCILKSLRAFANLMEEDGYNK